MAHQLYVILFPNGKRYFGITSRTLHERWRDHLSDARRRCRPIHMALRKYSERTSIFTLAFGSRDYILSLEISAIRIFQTRDRRFGYNVSVGGDSNPMMDNPHTPESRAKISAAGTGRVHSLEHRAKISLALKGKPLSPERKAKVIAATIDAMARPDIRAKISAGLKGKKRPNSPLTGRKQTPEHVANMRAALTGKKRTAETRERCRLAKLRTWARKRREAKTGQMELAL